jgi:hypothetical protein
VWHGCEWYVFYWSLINFVAILSEAVGHSLQGTKAVQQMFAVVGPRMERRLRVLAALPFFAALAIGMFMFFGAHHEVGTVYFQVDSRIRMMFLWTVIQKLKVLPFPNLYAPLLAISV